MKTLHEQKNFSLRLKSALIDSGLPVSATKLSIIFNRYSEQKITVGGARKWLKCEAIPAQAKLAVLADLTGTHPTWLRFGTGSRNQSPSKRVEFSREEQFLASELDLVPRQNIPILAVFVALLLADQAAKEHGHAR